MIVKIFCSLFLLKTFLCISIRLFILLYFLFLCNDNTNTKLHVKQIVTCLPCPAVNVLRSIIHSPVVFLRGCKKQLNKLLQHDNQDTQTKQTTQIVTVCVCLCKLMSVHLFACALISGQSIKDSVK